MADILQTLKEWGDIVFDREEEFIQTFVRTTDVEDLINVSWNSERIKFTYICSTGMHITDTADMSEWLKFINK